MLEENDVIQDSSLADAIEETIPEPSTGELESEETVSSEATEPKAETKEPPFNEHPRWKEVMEEKRIAQDRADRLEQQLLEISTKLATPKEKESDPYEGMAEEDKRFWKEVRRMAKEEARVIATEERKVYMKEHEATRQQLAMVAYKEFQVNHPDVTPNSPEENAIAKRVSLGYTPDDAYEIVVGAAKRKELEEELAKTKQNKQKVKNTQKLAANLETGGLAAGSPISPKEKLTPADIVEMHLRQQAVG